MSHWGWVSDDLPHRLLGQLGDDVVGRALAQVDREPHGHLHRQLVELDPGGEGGGSRNDLVKGRAKKNLAKFSDTCSVRADGLCIGSPRLVGGRKAGNSNLQEFFFTTLYRDFESLRG